MPSSRRRWAGPPFTALAQPAHTGRSLSVTRYHFPHERGHSADGRLAAPRPLSVTAAAQILQGDGWRTSGTVMADNPPRTAARRRRATAAYRQWRAAARDWQAEVWDLYDQTPELYFLLAWKAAVASQVRLVPAEHTEHGLLKTVTEGPDVVLLNALMTRPAQADFLARAVKHLSANGETYIIGRQDSDTVFTPYSPEEVTGGAGLRDPWMVDDGSGPVQLSVEEPIVRAWMPHPRRLQWPDSPVRSLLPVLRELHALTMMVSAQVDSRLAGAGVWFLPQSLVYPSSPNADAADGEDPFMLDLIDAMITPIKDRSSAAATVPLVVRVPDEVYDKIRQETFFRFDRAIDDKARELRDEAIRRVALGMDTPPEILTGLIGTNHWSAWQIDEAAVRIAIVPYLAVICHALTTLLQSQLSDGTIVWFDTSDITLRADRSDDAFAVYDRRELSGDALRRETGFTDADAPDAGELSERDGGQATGSRPGRPIPGDQ